MKKKEIQALKEELNSIKTILTIETPFLACLLRKCRIVLDEKIETAAATDREIIINPIFFQSLSKKAKIFIYCHEVLHVALRHALRMMGKDKEFFNYSTDAIVNNILINNGFKNVKFPPGLEPTTLRNVSEILAQVSPAKRDITKTEQEIAKMSAEEIYYLLKKNVKKAPPLNPMKDLLDALESGEKIVIQQGDPEASNPRSPEEREEYWEEALAQAIIESKIANKLPSGLERLVDGLCESKVRWQEIIKKEIINSLGKITISDWKKPSRRYKDLPGTKKLVLPIIWFLFDASGSIGPDELKQFLSEVYAVIKNRTKGIIIPWDDKVHPLIELKRPKDIEIPLKKGIPGGMGTIIFHALEEVLKLMKPGDTVIVLTDGWIWDKENEETQELFRKVGHRSTAAIFATIDTQINLPLKWKKVKIELVKPIKIGVTK